MAPVGKYIWTISLIITGTLSANGAAHAQDAQITIVHGYEGMAKYVAAAADADSEQKEKLFKQYVYQPYNEPCSGAGEMQYSDTLLRTPVSDVELLGNVLDEIIRANALDQISHAVAEATALMPTESLTVCVFAYPPEADNVSFIKDAMGGSFGFSESPGIMWVQLLPTDGWLDNIFSTVAHEYYHAANFPYDPVAPDATTLLDILIAEGSAESFADILIADYTPPFASPLDQHQQAKVWAEMRLVLDSTEPTVIEKYLFGDVDGIPFQAGYIIGFEIVQAYLAAHPHQPVSIWSRLEPRELLSGSGYDPMSK